jgi:hypothetical protein
MKPAHFAPWAEQTIGQSPAVASVTRVPDADPPCVTRVELATGAQIYLQWIGGAPPSGSAPVGEPDPVVTGPAPAPVQVPELATRGNLRTADVEQHLAALLNNGGHDQLADVSGYSADPKMGSDQQPYGIRIRFHDGSAVWALFRYTLPRGQQPSSGGEFKQREEV